MTLPVALRFWPRLGLWVGVRGGSRVQVDCRWGPRILVTASFGELYAAELRSVITQRPPIPLARLASLLPALAFYLVSAASWRAPA